MTPNTQVCRVCGIDSADIERTPPVIARTYHCTECGTQLYQTPHLTRRRVQSK